MKIEIADLKVARKPLSRSQYDEDEIIKRAKKDAKNTFNKYKNELKRRITITSDNQS